MATDLENAKSRRSEILQTLANLGGLDRPNASGSGHTVERVGYRQSLMQELKDINQMIGLLGGPWQVRS